MKAKVEVLLRADIFDPQGKTIKNALHHMEYKNVSDVKVGKLFYIDIDTNDKNQAKKELEDMCHQLLANPVIEDYKVELID